MNLLSLFHDADRENRKTILNLIESQPGTKLIDLGCGDGTFAMELFERSRAEEIYGADFLEQSCQKAIEKGIIARRVDLNEPLPFDDESFDAVHANQVIEHLIGTDCFVKEIYKILKPGGYSIISTPNLASLHNIFALILGKQPFPAHVSIEAILGNSLDPKHGMKHQSRGEVHLRIFTPASLRELFEYHGFEVEQIIGVGYYPFPGQIAAILSRLDRTHSAYITIKARKQ